MAVTSIELQVISRILTSDNVEEVNTLCSYDSSYYSVFKPQIEFIFNHRDKYNTTPDIFTFQAEFPDTTTVIVGETLEYLTNGLDENKQHIMLIETFNKMKDLGEGDVRDAWEWIGRQYYKVTQLDSTQPLNLIADAHKRSAEIAEYAKQKRIPTGFPEIDKAMYGGLSTVEELVIILARTNTGKSWVGVRLMESAQKNGFPVLYYSPEMQGSFLATRFDTWRGHFKNSDLYRGKYDEQYQEYLSKLSKEETAAFILEDKDAPDDMVNVRLLDILVKRNGIKLLIVDGLSYMEDDSSNAPDHIKYKNLCKDLFKLSKRHGCAVVVMMQANRDTKENKDAKGDAFPNIYNIEGSDHPARIATQVFALRQIFDKQVLDIRLEKSRSANNQKPVVSYSWDINTGNMQYIPAEDDNITAAITPGAQIDNIGGGMGIGITKVGPSINDIGINLDTVDSSNVEF